MTRFDPLDLDEVRKWSEGFTHPPGILETVAHWVGFAPLMVAWRFMWPDFACVEGCVLLPWEYSAETFAGWQAQFSGDCLSIENTVNHLHLWDVFGPSEVPDEGLIALGEALQRSWASALSDQFPDRTFEVSFANDEVDYGPTVSIKSV